MVARIVEHPILGVKEQKALVRFTFDGKALEGYEGEPIAVALKASGLMVHRYTAKEHKPRGIFCAIGRCTDCVMVVDGVPNVRTCITPLKAGIEAAKRGLDIGRLHSLCATCQLLFLRCCYYPAIIK